MTWLIRRPPWHVWTRPGFRLGFGVVPHHIDGDEARPRDGFDVLLWLGPLIVSYRHRRQPAAAPKPFDALSAILRARDDVAARGQRPTALVVSPDVLDALRREADRMPMYPMPVDPYRLGTPQVMGMTVTVNHHLPPQTVMVLTDLPRERPIRFDPR